MTSFAGKNAHRSVLSCFFEYTLYSFIFIKKWFFFCVFRLIQHSERRHHMFTMKKNRISHTLLAGTGVSETDSARLTLETIETLGDLAAGLSHTDLMSLLRRVIQEGVAAVKAAEHTVSLREAAWASVEARKDLRPTTRRDLRHFVRRILRVEGAADMPLRSMSSADCKRILAAAFGSSPSSYRKGRVILSSVFSYGIRQEWTDSNPVTRIEAPAVQERLIEPLAPEEVERLKATASRPEFRDMRFSLNLMLYGGIRPTEVSRLLDKDINWEDGYVIIRPHAGKTGGGRAVPLRGVGGIRKRDCRIPRNWKRRWQALRRAAGFRLWVPDVCRHTFATYHAALFRNLPELQLEMGHRDTSLLRSRYMVPARRKDAEAFWHGAGQPRRVKKQGNTDDCSGNKRTSEC